MAKFVELRLKSLEEEPLAEDPLEGDALDNDQLEDDPLEENRQLPLVYPIGQVIQWWQDRDLNQFLLHHYFPPDCSVSV